MRRSYDKSRCECAWGHQQDEEAIERLINIVASVASSRHAGPAGAGYVRQIGGYGRDAVLAVPDLIRCLKHRQASVRAAAASSLGEIGPRADEAVPDLLKLRQDEDAQVREAAEKALAVLTP